MTVKVVTVEVNLSAQNNSSIIWEEDDRYEQVLTIRQQHMRLYPTGIPYVFCTTGTISYAGLDQISFVDFLHFTGTNTVTMPHPNAETVKIELVGKFIRGYTVEEEFDEPVEPPLVLLIDEGGEPTITYPSFTFEPSYNQIKSSVPGYGTIKVSYTVRFDRYLFNYAGLECPDPVSTDPDLYDPDVLEDSVLVAIDNDGTAATHNMSAPSCDAFKGFGILTQKKILPKLLIEVDPGGKPKADKIKNKKDKDAVFFTNAKIKVNPPSNLKLETDYGLLYQLYPSSTVIRDSLSFNNSSSVELSHTPSTSVNIISEGDFYDERGNTILVKFAQEGDRVNVVSREDDGSYKHVGIRTVGPNEIVTTSLSNNEIKALGNIQAEYRYSFDKYELEFSYAFLDPENVFQDAIISVKGDVAGWEIQGVQKGGTLKIEAPKLKGK